MYCEFTLTESPSNLLMVFPYCRAGLRTQLPSLTLTEAFRWCSWIKDWHDIFPFLRTNTKLGQSIYPISTYFAKLSQIYNIKKPCTSFLIGRIPHTRTSLSRSLLKLSSFLICPIIKIYWYSMFCFAVCIAKCKCHR